MTVLPAGFSCFVTNVGIKDDTDDFVVVAADTTGAADGVFTKSRFAGPSVHVSREHLADGRARAIVIVSKNANVATGSAGLADAREFVAGVADRLGCDATDIVVASTGVIGRPFPMDRIRAGIASIPSALPSRDCRRRRPRDHDHRHRRQGRRGDDRHERRPRRRHRQGRRDDRARHGNDDHGDVHRRRDRTDRALRRLPACDRPHVQLREHRHRHVDERHRGRARQRPRRPCRHRRVRDRAARRGPLADQAGRRATAKAPRS